MSKNLHMNLVITSLNEVKKKFTANILDTRS